MGLARRFASVDDMCQALADDTDRFDGPTTTDTKYTKRGARHLKLR